MLLYAGACRLAASLRAVHNPAVATWTRPTPDKDETWTKPSYVPTPGQSPVIQPYREDNQPLYTPSAPEFKPAEMPEQQKEMPKGPNMPGRCCCYADCVVPLLVTSTSVGAMLHHSSVAYRALHAVQNILAMQCACRLDGRQIQYLQHVHASHSL